MTTKAKATATPPDTAAAPMVDMDALPPGGGSYTRQPDGTLVLNTPAIEPPADSNTPATSE